MRWLTRLRRFLRPAEAVDVSISCGPTGITLFQSNNTVHHIPWQDIKHLIAYKKDCVTVDQIRLIIGAGPFATEVTEEDPGFDSLVAAILEHLPTSLPGWREKLAAAPAFETSLTHVYPTTPAPDAPSTLVKPPSPPTD